MSPESKRRLLRYGIAVDLVIVITGVALLLPQIPAAVIVVLYAIAAALSAVKGGWRGGTAATGGGLIALLAAFHDTVPLTYTAAFVAVGAAICAIAAMLPKRAATPTRPAATTDAPPLAPVVAFPEDDRAEQAAKAREEAERKAAEAARKLEEERVARERAEREAAERAAKERAEAERVAREKLEQERAATARKAEEQRVAVEKAARERADREAAARLAREKKNSEPKRGLFASIFRREPPRPSVNLRPKTLGDNAVRKPASTQKPARKPRVLMLEKRRGTADTILPKLKQHGVEAEVVERWIDAVDELFRFRPDAFFLDVELPDFDKVYKAVTEHSPSLPIVLTSKQNGGALPAVCHAATSTRPYEAEAVVALVRRAFENPDDLLAKQAMPPEEAQEIAYLVGCFNCGVQFDAADADWCSCLTKERTLVCTNCLTCFCKAPPSYKETFRIGAPPHFLERKTAERRPSPVGATNPPPEQVRRPLVMLVEDDDEIKAIVQRVCTNLGYGFVSENNGDDGLTLARAYRPDLILCDAFLPKRDGREMCRMLKEEPGGAECKMVVMTGVYVDTKYKTEALQRFRVDDYLSKPVSITDLINLLQRHLEGVTGLPAQEDLHALHRREFEMSDDGVRPYEICCFTCNAMFDAASAAWCTDAGSDGTLVCPHCNHCFCKAPPAYRERFWIDAPPSLLERKLIGSTRTVAAKSNPQPADVKRPSILLVEDDENVQLIVKTVVTAMNYGCIVADDGEEGLTLARQYEPDLILSDAFVLKGDALFSRAKSIVMTGLYADRKLRDEALASFHADDYLAKPLAVGDLIKVIKKHLPQAVQPTM